ncbi:MAG: methyltransferase domain-containing protein [Planctomycetes bacterium]|nr:methyltransferase domain-containing protein [Planctomycetota bacterium]MCW8135581.1 methyltransferase domain-containing protein [Planctomycetota bacterium]
MSNASTIAARPEFEALRARQKSTWAAGDYARIGVTLQMVGEQLCESLNLRAGSRVLDVAAGNGNATLAAARRFAEVVSTDYVPALLAGGEARARAEGHDVRFVEAAAESLPFDDAEFDYVLSSFGVMFAADHRRAADEMVRVCRPGGAIGMANWTPGGFIGQLFKVVTRHVPPPAGAQSPLRWGTEEGLRELFGDATELHTSVRHFVFRYRSAQHFVDMFRTWYGPVLRAFEALAPETRPALEADLLTLVQQHNLSKDGGLVIPSEYLEVRAVRVK